MKGKFVQVLLTKQASEYLDQLVATGLFGVDREDAVARMVDAALRVQLVDGLLAPRRRR